jgi:hypothetical protein
MSRNNFEKVFVGEIVIPCKVKLFVIVLQSVLRRKRAGTFDPCSFLFCLGGNYLTFKSSRIIAGRYFWLTMTVSSSIRVSSSLIFFDLARLESIRTNTIKVIVNEKSISVVFIVVMVRVIEVIIEPTLPLDLFEPRFIRELKN